MLVLALAAWAAVNLGYHAFAAAMSVVNAVSRAPLVYLHGEIMSEATQGTTIRYEVVRQPDASAYAHRHSDNLIVFEAENRSRWPIAAVRPDCTFSYADGSRAPFLPITRRERTGLDDGGHVSTAVPPGGRIAVTLPTARVQQGGTVLRADCTFDLSVPWWVWASEVPRPSVARR